MRIAQESIFSGLNNLTVNSVMDPEYDRFFGFTERLFALLQGETVLACINQNVVYRSLTEEPANVYSLLMVAGYLKAIKKELQPDGAFMCQISIPNKEIAAVYKGEVLSHLLQVGLIT